MYRDHLTAFVQAVPLLPCTRDEVANWIEATKVGHKNETVRIRFRSVKAFLNWCQEIREIPAPKMRKLMPPSDGAVPDPLTEDEVRRLMAVCNTRYHRAMVHLILETGIRATELCGLDRNDIKAEYVIIRTGKTSKYGPKTPAISPELRELLLSISSPKREPVFTNDKGRRLDKNGLYQRLRPLYEQAGISKTKMGPHALRHTVGTETWRHTGDIRYIQQLLGHRQLAMTQIYTTIDTSAQVERHRAFNLVKMVREGEANGKSAAA